MTLTSGGQGSPTYTLANRWLSFAPHLGAHRLKDANFIGDAVDPPPAGIVLLEHGMLPMEAATCHGRSRGAMICGSVPVDSDEPIITGGHPDEAYPDWCPRRAGLRAGIVGARRATGAPGAKAGSPQARLEAIVREYAQAQRGRLAAYRKATTDDERKKAVASRPDAKKYVARMMELVESAPDDPAAVNALLWVVNNGGQTREVDWAIELLARDHAQDPKIMRIGSTPADSTSPAGERLLRAIAEKSPDRAVQRRASFALARLLNNEAELVRLMKQNNNGFAASVTIFQGPERTEALLAKDPDALAKQGESLFKTAVEKFGDAPRGSRSSKTRTSGPCGSSATPARRQRPTTNAGKRSHRGPTRTNMSPA